MVSKLLSFQFVMPAAVAAGLVWASADPDPAPAGGPPAATGKTADAGGAKGDAKPKDKRKVRARAFLSTDRLPAGRTAEVAVVLDVAEGWHVNTDRPAAKHAVPTTVTVKTERGTVVGRFAFPTLPPLREGGPRRPVERLVGQVVLRAPVRVPATAAGGKESLEVSVKYQACNDSQCLRPKTLTFGGTLPVAAPGEPVRPANREWFQTPAPTTGPPATRTAERP